MILKLLGDVRAWAGETPIRSVSFTGNHGQVAAELSGAPYEFETIAQVEGCVAVMPGVAQHYRHGRTGNRPVSARLSRIGLGTP